MNSNADDILNKAQTLPSFKLKFDKLFAISEEVIIFGSYAAGVQNEDSDIDILFVCKGKPFKSRFLDFVCISPERITLKSWLGTELANHVAKYGVWIKGTGHWRNQVFISNTALERKKIIILNRLTHIWIKNKGIGTKFRLKLFRDVILDSYRLIQMSEGIAVPPNRTLIERFQNEDRNILQEVCRHQYLGKIGEAFVNEIFTVLDLEQLNVMMKEVFGTGYRTLD
jgi:predicted nucleotidyltransferase